METITTDYFN